MSGSAFDDVRRFATLDSTNRYLVDEARRGVPEGVVAVADHQSAGRGRLGRSWEAPPGASLLASVLVRPVLAVEHLYLCTAAVARAAADACATVAGVRPSLKWPNDLLVDGRKLAGVLAEADPDAPGGPPGSLAVVVGVGINVTWPGPPGAGGTSLLEASGHPVDREELLGALVTALGARRGELGTTGGRRRLAAEWKERCSTLGRRVRVELGTGSFEGTAVDLDEGGRLVVRTTEGIRVVQAGDVHHLREVAQGTGADDPLAPN